MYCIYKIQIGQEWRNMTNFTSYNTDYVYGKTIHKTTNAVKKKT